MRSPNSLSTPVRDSFGFILSTLVLTILLILISPGFWGDSDGPAKFLGPWTPKSLFCVGCGWLGCG